MSNALKKLQVSKSQLHEANALFRENKFKEAIEIYKKIESKSLHESGIISFNLTLAEKKWTYQRALKRNEDKTINIIPTLTVKSNAFQYVTKSMSDWTGNNKIIEPEVYPKVSAIMTCFNADSTIQEAVESLLSQNYPNLEVVVCDDFSSDNSWRILQEMKKRCSALKIIRNNYNCGTYLSKNRAIEKATGEILIFQDSDDISHPSRALVQVNSLLNNKKLIATRTKYLRYNHDSGNIIPVGELLSKYGLITLCVWRRAFREIGYFDTVRRAGDDEWYQRLLHTYGKSALENIDVTLYLARLLKSSLVADMITFSDDGSKVEQISSFTRRQYVEMFTQRFKSMNEKHSFLSSFPPFPKNSNMRYPDGIKALNSIDSKVIFSLCSIPSRYESLIKVIRCIENQADEIFVYLDKYEEVPSELLEHRKVVINRSQNFSTDHRDNGKFLPFNYLKSVNSDFYYFTIDDDIEYPHDYVHTMISKIEKYKRLAIVGVHGVVIEEVPKAYFKRRFTYHFSSNAIDHDVLVNNLGTGTVAFHSSLLSSANPDQWPLGGMVDIIFSIECKKLRIPMVCVSRHTGWLVEFEQAKSNPNLYSEFSDKEAAIVDLLVLNSPWGYKAIDSAIISLAANDGEELRNLLPKYHNDINVTSCFSRLR